MVIDRAPEVLLLLTTMLLRTWHLQIRQQQLEAVRAVVPLLQQVQALTAVLRYLHRVSGASQHLAGDLQHTHRVVRQQHAQWCHGWSLGQGGDRGD